MVEEGVVAPDVEVHGPDVIGYFCLEERGALVDEHDAANKE